VLRAQAWTLTAADLGKRLDLTRMPSPPEHVRAGAGAAAAAARSGPRRVRRLVP